METLQWETIHKNNFSVFIRDLSESLNINLKHMIEDLDKETLDLSLDKKSKKHKKKKHIKKKDIIIQEQNKLREQKKIDEDLRTIDFLFRNLTDTTIYDNFEKLKTEQGKQIYKLKLLLHFKKKKQDYFPHILNLYFNLKYGNHSYISDDKDFIKISEKLDKLLLNYDYKTYMMKELSHLLPPLNFWDKNKIQFDSWQKDVIQKIKHKESVLVKAPTSSGKTFIAMSTGIIHQKILYVCPAKPIVYQVGSHFVKMGYKVHYLVENMGHMSYDSKTNIFIGTPDMIEKYLYKIYTEFDYAVFDEIHNLNDYETGISYENIIKLIRCNFLALSATIENIDFLRDIFQRIHGDKKIHYIEYTTRFINQQRWIYTDKLNKLHPITCLDTNDFQSFDLISLTPNDCIVLYEQLEELFEDDESLEEIIENLSPDNYFSSDKLLTLDDTKDYERFMKSKLKEIYSLRPEEIQMIINNFRPEIKNSKHTILSFLKDCKKKDLLPLLYFHTDALVSQEIFMNIYNELQTQEELNYPYHYTILEKKDDLYQKYKEKREIYSDNIKIKTKDAKTEKTEKMNRYDKEQRDKYISDMSIFYEQCIYKCEGTENEDRKIKNLRKEMDHFLLCPDFREQDIYKKHPEYCFTHGDPMSGDEIKKIRKEIKSSTGLNIAYENPVFQLLKRGIGLYLKSMPDEYNWILQRLMSEKKLGIVISDRTLCLGIDLPIRSVALSGYKNPDYTTSDYLQMSGRAGRRGHDNQGNIIFHNVSNYLELMKGSLPQLIGSDKPMYESYSLLNQMNKNISLENMNWMIHKTNQFQNTQIELPIHLHKLGWNLRYYENTISFLKLFPKLEKKLFMIVEDRREYYLLDLIFQELFNLIETQSYLDIYKKNKIEDKINEIIPIFIEIGQVTKDIVNSVDKSFLLTKQYSEIIFHKCKTLIYKYRGFD